MRFARRLPATHVVPALALAGLLGITAAWPQPPPATVAPAPTPAAAPGTPVPAPPSLPPPPAPLCLPPLSPGEPVLIPLDRPITLPEAIAVALREQPQLTISAGQAQAAAGRTLQARSGELPTLSLSAQYNRSGPSNRAGAPAGTSFSSGVYTASVSGRQLLFDFGRTPAEVAQARNLEHAAQQGLLQTRQDVINQVKQGYYTLLEDTRLIDVQRRNLTDQQAHLDLARARYVAGVSPRADVYRAEASVAQAELAVTQAENTAQQSRVALNLAMGIDVRTPTLVLETTEPEPPLPELPSLLAEAYRNRPEIIQLQANAEASRLAVRVARTTNRPTIFADGSYGWSGATFPPGNRSWSYGMAVSWPFFDVGLTRGTILAAQGNLLSAEGQLNLGMETVGQEVTQSYMNVQAAAEQVATAAAGVTSAEENLRVALGRYEAGVAAYIEVTDAQTALLQAQTSQVTALYGLSLARAQLAHALGVAAY